MANMVNDVVGLVHALGYATVAAVVGHDFGSATAAYCALSRPDIFKSVVLMSAPFGGPSPSASAQDASSLTPFQALNKLLATLDPPRKHYMMHFSTPEAAEELINPPGGLHSFLRTYLHVKSADWKGNDGVRPLKSAAEMSLLPDYYIMPLAKTMPEAVAPYAPSAEEIAQTKWLPDDELATYVAQYTASGFHILRAGSRARLTRIAASRTHAGSKTCSSPRTSRLRSLPCSSRALRIGARTRPLEQRRR